MATAAILRAVVTADTAQAEAKLGAFGKQIELVAGKGSTGLAKLGAAGKLAFVALGVAAGVGLAKAVSATQQFGENVLILKRQLGLTAEDASRLEVVFEHFGIGTAQASVGLGIFEKNLVNGSKYVKQYGLSLTDATGQQKPFLQVLGEAADKFRALPPGAERAAFAMNLFGRSGKTLIPILQLGSKGIADLAAEADKFGLTLSGSNLEAIHKYALAQHDLGLASTGLKLSIGETLIPILTKFDTVLTGVVEVLNKVPGPIKTVVLGAIALGGAMVALGIATGIVRGALANLGIGLGADAAAELTDAAATEANAAAHTGLGFSLAGTLKSAGPLALVLGGLAVHQWAVADSAKQAAEGHTIQGNAEHVLGVITKSTLDIGLDYAKWVFGLFGSSNDAAAATDNLAGSLPPLAHNLLDSVDASNVFKAALDTANLHIGLLGSGIQKFMGMSNTAFRNWRVGTRAALNSVAGGLQSLAGQSHLTAADIVKDFDKHLAAMKTYQKNWHTLLGRHIPQDLAMQLQSMGSQGAGIVAALATANNKQFARMISDWKKARGIAVNTSADISNAWANVPRKVQTDYYVVQHGYIPGGIGQGHPTAVGGMVYMAGGGAAPVMEVTRPTYIGGGAIAGEGGREFVLPANARGEAWVVNAVLKGLAQGFAQWNGGVTSVPVHVYLDGREIRAGLSRGDALRGART